MGNSTKTSQKIEWTHNKDHEGNLTSSVGSTDEGFYLIKHKKKRPNIFFMKNLTGKFQLVEQIR